MTSNRRTPPSLSASEIRERRLSAEKRTAPLTGLGVERPYQIGLGFPNRYEVGMSNLGFQWTLSILANEPNVGVERFFVDDDQGPVRTFESGRPLGDLDVVAFSVSWEMDYPHVLRALQSAGIPLLAAERSVNDPLVVFGGNCSRINPAPLFPYVDLVAAGDAEKLVRPLADAIRDSNGDRGEILDRLAGAPGFFSPLRGESDLSAPVLIQQKRPRENFGEHQVPHTVILTPETELSDKLLVEIARGCTEMCRFCWAAYAFAPIVRHSAAEILAVADAGRSKTDRIGLIATAVADHPEIGTILGGLRDLGFHIALSSIKIDALSEPLLDLLHAQGERALAIAPEAGNDRLRRAVNKKVSDEMLDEKMRMIFRAGFTHLKLYLQIGLPGETDSDVDDLVTLVRRAHDLAIEEGRKRGRVATVIASVNCFVPKPHTPFESESLIPLAEIERKMTRLARDIGRIPNTTMRGMPPKEAVWEAYLAKAAAGASPILERISAGERPGKMIREFREEISRVVWGEMPRGERPWTFLRKSLPAAAAARTYAGDM